LVVLVAFPGAAHAEPFEARTYLDIGAEWRLAPSRAPSLRLGPFAREESRFRGTGLSYVKAFAGGRITLLPWLCAAAYYAHKDFPASGRPQAHIAALDVFVAPKPGPFVVSDKSGFEGHITDGFFRYRNALELRWESPLGWLAPFVQGELRVDSDAARVNLLDARAGVLLTLPHEERARLSLRTFYCYETNRRGKPGWSGVHLLGAALAAAF